MNNEDKNKLEEICKPTLLEYALPLVGGLKYIERKYSQMDEGIDGLEALKYSRLHEIMLVNMAEAMLLFYFIR